MKRQDARYTSIVSSGYQLRLILVLQFRPCIFLVQEWSG